MVRILGISGSLRAGSFNTALLRAAQELAVPGMELELATLHGIPLYDGDLEQRDGVPAAVQALKARVLASDGLLLATPEYNNGIPGVFKNAIACGLPIDPASVAANAALMEPGRASSRGPVYDLIKNPFRKVRPDDPVHASVGFRADIEHCNNPPANCPIVDDAGLETGRFVHV